MSMAEAGRPIVDWSPRDDAHSGLRNTDRPAARPTGRVQHGYNRVQEIVSDTGETSERWKPRGLITMSIASFHKDSNERTTNSSFLKTSGKLRLISLLYLYKTA